MRAFEAVLAVVMLLGLGCGATPPRPMQRLPSGSMPFLSLEHLNSMGTTFTLIGLDASIDGHQVLALESAEPLPARLCVSRGRASAGAHDIRVRAHYRGHGFGVFSYLDRYQFNATATTHVDIPADAFGLEVQSIGYEGGGVTVPLEDRPHIRFVARAERANPEGGCVPGPTPVSAPPPG